MNDANQEKLPYKFRMRMRRFEQNPCIENARPVFIGCRSLGVPLPELVLDIILKRYKIDEKVGKEQDKWLVKMPERLIAHAAKLLPSETMLSCALRTKSPNEAHVLHDMEEEKRRIKNPNYKPVFTSYNSFWRKLDRLLHEKISEIIESQGPPDKSSSEFVIPGGVDKKLRLYKQLIDLLY